MCNEAPLLRSLRPSDAAPASPAHAERSGACPTPCCARALKAAAAFRVSRQGSDSVRICTRALPVSQMRCRC
jgi:hypothetical protein